MEIQSYDNSIYQRRFLEYVAATLKKKGRRRHAIKGSEGPPLSNAVDRYDTIDHARSRKFLVVFAIYFRRGISLLREKCAFKSPFASLILNARITKIATSGRATPLSYVTITSDDSMKSQFRDHVKFRMRQRSDEIADDVITTESQLCPR